MKAKHLLPVILMLLFAISRWPGLMRWNFSAVYALMFCAGVYFPGRLAWWLPLLTIAISDVLLDCFYHVNWVSTLASPEMLVGYAAYLGMIWLGRRFQPKSSFFSLVCGGLLGAILFYFVTNTASWFFNIFNAPEYTRTFAGWLTALTRGMSNYPFPVKMQTWELFRNTLASGGLFTALFAGAMKFMEALLPAEEDEEKAEAPAPEEPAQEPQKTEA